MMNRRQFLELSAKLSATGVVLGRAAQTIAAPLPHTTGLTYGVQMYMVRELAAKDVAGALKSIHDAGFTQVELYPIAYHRAAAELRRMVADAGLGAVAGHFDYTAREMSIDYAHGLGLKYLVCPMLPAVQQKTLDGYRQAAQYFSQWGESAKSAGMQFVFHNHCYEFKPMEGTTGFETLMKSTDAALVKLEFDLYWLTQGGQDPALMLRQYADRAVLVHLKDRQPNSPTGYSLDEGGKHMAEMGQGNIQWKPLLAQAKRQGIRYAFLDQDFTSLPVDESMKRGREYLRRLAV